MTFFSQAVNEERKRFVLQALPKIAKNAVGIKPPDDIEESVLGGYAATSQTALCTSSERAEGSDFRSCRRAVEDQQLDS